MVECIYGCGKEGKFILSNGKPCCSEFHTKCEEVRKKNSLAHGNRFYGLNYWEMPNYVKGSKVAWNKGVKTGRNPKHPYPGGGRASTEEKEIERRKKISESMKSNSNGGGIRQGSGRGKKGWFNNVWCDSSWELAWVIYHTDLNIAFKRNNEKFEYFYNGKKHFYYPDFILEGNYVEIKGRRGFEDLSERNKEKINQFPKKIIVLYENEMDLYLSYCISKYCNNFVRLLRKRTQVVDET